MDSSPHENVEQLFVGTLAFKSPELIFSDALIKFIIGVVNLEAKLIEIITDKKRSNETISK